MKLGGLPRKNRQAKTSGIWSTNMAIWPAKIWISPALTGRSLTMIMIQTATAAKKKQGFWHSFIFSWWVKYRGRMSNNKGDIYNKYRNKKRGFNQWIRLTCTNHLSNSFKAAQIKNIEKWMIVNAYIKAHGYPFPIVETIPDFRFAAGFTTLFRNFSQIPPWCLELRSDAPPFPPSPVTFVQTSVSAWHSATPHAWLALHLWQKKPSSLGSLRWYNK